MHPTSTQALTGLTPVDSGPLLRSSLEAGAVDEPIGLKGVLSPQNPLFWFGGILAVTAGLIGLSGSARVGRAKVSASLDKG
jgi:hypothetical protein